MIRMFPLFWGGITVLYACLVLYRIFAHARAPGLPTLASFAAVTAVWAEFVAFVRRGLAWRLTAVVAVLITIVVNAIVSFHAVVDGRGLPVARLSFTLLFVLVLCERLLELLAYR